MPVTCQDIPALGLRDGCAGLRRLARFPDRQSLLDEALLVLPQGSVLAVGVDLPAVVAKVAYPAVSLAHPGKAPLTSSFVKTFPSPTTVTSHRAARFIVPNLVSVHDGRVIRVSSLQVRCAVGVKAVAAVRFGPGGNTFVVQGFLAPALTEFRGQTENSLRFPGYVLARRIAVTCIAGPARTP